MSNDSTAEASVATLRETAHGTTAPLHPTTVLPSITATDHRPTMDLHHQTASIDSWIKADASTDLPHYAAVVINFVLHPKVVPAINSAHLPKADDAVNSVLLQKPDDAVNSVLLQKADSETTSDHHNMIADSKKDADRKKVDSAKKEADDKKKSLESPKDFRLPLHKPPPTNPSAANPHAPSTIQEISEAILSKFFRARNRESEVPPEPRDSHDTSHAIQDVKTQFVLGIEIREINRTERGRENCRWKKE